MHIPCDLEYIAKLLFVYRSSQIQPILCPFSLIQDNFIKYNLSRTWLGTVFKAEANLEKGISCLMVTSDLRDQKTRKNILN